MADVLTSERDICRTARKGDRAVALEKAVAESVKEMAQWKRRKMRLYERYKSGEISREDYVERVETGKVWIEELERSRREAQAELECMREVAGSEEVAGLSVLEIFDRERLKVLIEKVVVYEEDVMEIVWKVRSPFKAEYFV